MSETGVSAAGNTNNPCLILLRSKGYDLWLEPTRQGSLWCAAKNGKSFMGHSGPELLGIVTLWEAYQDRWNVQSPDIYGELINRTEDISDV